MVVLAHLKGVISSLGIPGGIAVERRADATIDDRRNPVPGALSTFQADPAVIQPAPERELLRLPSGDRSKGVIMIHSQVVLRVARESSGQESDVVLFREPTPTPAGILQGRYTVAKAGDWQLVGGFTSVLAIKQESDAA